MQLGDMMDQQFLANAADTKADLERRGCPRVDAATLAQAMGYDSAFPVLLVVQRQNAWDELGLDHDHECAGPCMHVF